MSVVYALIARQQNVLCEYTDAGTGGNFATVTRAVLKHLAQQQQQHATSASSTTPDLTSTGAAVRSVFPYNAFNFYFHSEDHLTFMCMAEEAVHANVAFAFLGELRTLFLHKYGHQAQTAIAYGMSAFGATIQGLMKKYDNLKMETPMSELLHKMERVKMLMIENVEQLMERGEKIDLLVVRTEKLQRDAIIWDGTAKKVKNVYWWKNFRAWIVLGLCLGLLGFVISFLVCGIDFSTCGARIEHHASKAVNRELDRFGHFKDDVNDKVAQVGDKIQGGISGDDR